MIGRAFSSVNHRTARAIECPVAGCRAPVGVKCNNKEGHRARWYHWYSETRPLPSPTQLTRLREHAGKAPSFMDVFGPDMLLRAASAGGSQQVLVVYEGGRATTQFVRVEIANIALECGLLRGCASERPSYEPTPRGLAWLAALCAA